MIRNEMKMRVLPFRHLTKQVPNCISRNKFVNMIDGLKTAPALQTDSRSGLKFSLSLTTNTLTSDQLIYE